MKRFALLLLFFLCLTAQAWQQKPTLGTQIDWANPLSRGLVGCWLFNERSGTIVQDLSGNRNHGTLVGDPTWIPGKFGSGIDFDGIGDYVLLYDGALIATSANATVTAWIKTSASNLDGGRPIYCERAASGDDIWKFDSLDLNHSTNGIQFAHRDDAGALTFVYATNEIVINDGKWHFVAVTKQGSSIVLYVDGVVDKTGTLNGSDTFTDAGLESRLAIDGAYPSYATIGQIDHVMIYSEALSASEIAQLYREPFCMFEEDNVAVLHKGVSVPAAGGQVIIIFTSMIIPIFIWRKFRNGE